MHYPLAMLLLASTDQRPRKGLEERGPLQSKWTGKKRTDGWQEETEDRKSRKKGRELRKAE